MSSDSTQNLHPASPNAATRISSFPIHFFLAAPTHYQQTPSPPAHLPFSAILLLHHRHHPLRRGYHLQRGTPHADEHPGQQTASML